MSPKENVAKVLVPKNGHTIDAKRVRCSKQYPTHKHLHTPTLNRN